MKWNSILWALLLIFTMAFCISCGDDDDDDDSSSGDDDDDSGPVDDDARADSAEVLVVTTDEMVSAWMEYADWKDRTGMRCDVVVIDDVVSASNDPVALREYLNTQYQNGVRYVLLGGDADQIPYLRGYTETWTLEDYYGTAPIQTFFEDLDTNWDADNDGTYGELDDDITVEDLRAPELSVGRVPVETEAEANAYINKLIYYESGQGRVPERATAPLFLADVAASVPIVGEIDGGMMHEQLIADYFPTEYQDNMRRLYGTQLYADLVGAEVGNTSKVLQAFVEEGYAISVANAHGGFNDLTLALSRGAVEALTNDVPFVFFTTSCLSGNFADIATGNGDQPIQTGTDSVAEEIVKMADGGAVAYVGNTLIGLGPVGGAQFNHALCRSIFKEDKIILGEAMKNTRRTLYSEVASVTLGDAVIEFPMDWDIFPNTEWYTQRSVLLLGDPALRIWTGNDGALAIEGATTFSPGYNVIDVTVKADGSPSANTLVALSQFGGTLIQKSTDDNGAAQFKVQLEEGDRIVITAYAKNMAASTVVLTQE